MANGKIPLRRRARALLAVIALAALAALCAWGGWAAVTPDLDTFVLPGARDIQQKQLSSGLQSLEFSYDQPVMAQSRRLRATLEERGWQAARSLEMDSCDGPCLLGEVTLVFTRVSLFNLVHEVATIDQSGAAPFRVRVVLRRCVRLPSVGCWPPG
jgi:hypothetical protein